MGRSGFAALLVLLGLGSAVQAVVPVVAAVAKGAAAGAAKAGAAKAAAAKAGAAKAGASKAGAATAGADGASGGGTDVESIIGKVKSYLPDPQQALGAVTGAMKDYADLTKPADKITLGSQLQDLEALGKALGEPKAYPWVENLLTGPRPDNGLKQAQEIKALQELHNVPASNVPSAVSGGPASPEPPVARPAAEDAPRLSAATLLRPAPRPPVLLPPSRQ